MCRGRWKNQIYKFQFIEETITSLIKRKRLNLNSFDFIRELELNEVKAIKKVTFQLSVPVNGEAVNKEFIVNVKDDAIFAEALAMVDNYILTHPDESHFIEHKENSFIRCYLQLFWNPQENNIYSDINLFAGSNRGIMPIESNMNFNLYPDCEISMTSDA